MKKITFQQGSSSLFEEFNAPYDKLGFLESIRSHYRYLKHMGNPG